MFGFLKRLFSSKNDRELKKLMPIVGRINELEPSFKALSEEALQGKTAEFRQRLYNGESLESVLPEAFATVREAGRRVLGMRHYDVQLVGGLVLHSGRIAEMRTGEGKTLVATLPVYTNALLGRGVHVVTVNDYLASRDAEWMGRIYRYLGMSVGTIVHGLSSRQRQESYGSDITYGTNNEFGFDYLRDNMQFYLADYVQRELYFAIVDEVDSILIDEARTPLIISGRSEESSKLYVTINPLIPKLRKVEIGGLDEYRKLEQDGKTPPPGDYVIDEKAHSVFLTEDGVEKMERLLGIDNLYDPKHIEMNHHVQQALRAHTLYKRDVNYIVEDGKVVIVDEHTGRKMPGRRWSDGLHQAVEAKEGVRIEEENRTLATVTFQNYFRMYKKLGGMTGTADTEAEEFAKIYNLDVTVIPTNRPMVRQDNNDLIYKTQREKLTKVIDEIMETHQKGQPVLVGTVSVEKNEQLAEILRKKNIPHQLLNAKHHAREAEIIAQAGRKGAVTIATNMAGRGTDILLGGNFEVLAKQEAGPAPQPNADVYRDGEEYEKALEEYQQRYDDALEKHKAACLEERKEVLALGGLHIIGTERHESRRIDNQLRGRAGRQGDVGSSRFYLSLEDDLMRIFAADRIKWLMEKLGMPDGEPIEHPWVTKSIINAQKKVEAHHFDSRKHLLDYDDVMNQQRKTIYRQRRDVLEGRVQDDDGKQVDLLALPKDKPWPKEAKNPLAVVLGEAPSEEERSDAMSQVLEGTWQQILEILEEVVDELVADFCAERHAEDWDLEGLQEEVKTLLNVDVDFSDIETTRDAISDLIFEVSKKYLAQRAAERGDGSFRSVCRWIYLKEIDNQWMEHLQAMDHLREGIGLRGYGQKDPKSEYKKEGFAMFSEMMYRIKENTIKTIAHIRFQDEVRAEDFAPKRKPEQFATSGGGENKAETNEQQAAQPQQNATSRVGRNDPCHCGSGKKYKKCHLPIDEKAQPNRI